MRVETLALVWPELACALIDSHALSSTLMLSSTLVLSSNLNLGCRLNCSNFSWESSRVFSRLAHASCMISRWELKKTLMRANSGRLSNSQEQLSSSFGPGLLWKISSRFYITDRAPLIVLSVGANDLTDADDSTFLPVPRVWCYISKQTTIRGDISAVIIRDASKHPVDN